MLALTAIYNLCHIEKIMCLWNSWKWFVLHHNALCLQSWFCYWGKTVFWCVGMDSMHVFRWHALPIRKITSNHLHLAALGLSNWWRMIKTLMCFCAQDNCSHSHLFACWSSCNGVIILIYRLNYWIWSRLRLFNTHKNYIEAKSRVNLPHKRNRRQGDWIEIDLNSIQIYSKCLLKMLSWEHRGQHFLLCSKQNLYYFGLVA